MITKVKLITNSENLIIGYITSPIEENDITYEVDLDKLTINVSYLEANGDINYNAERAEEIRLEKEQARLLTKKRNKRKSLLEAFDKWEKAVLRGREEENDSIMLWYYDLLDLKESAFENVPERIKYYMY